MKKKDTIILIFLSILILMSCKNQRTSDIDESTRKINLQRVVLTSLQNTGGLVYLLDKPFTGIGFSMWDEKQPQYERLYKDGKPDGVWKEYNSDGKLEYEETYKNGEKDGQFKRYNNGKLEFEGYKEKKIRYLKQYYNNGNIEYEETYHEEPDSTEILTRKDYYYNGNLKEESSRILKEYKNNTLIDYAFVSFYVGSRKLYYENGQLSIEANYKNGKLAGEFREYNENGQLKAQKNY